MTRERRTLGAALKYRSLRRPMALWQNRQGPTIPRMLMPSAAPAAYTKERR